jgi:secreted PhoX family phosphatase
MKEYNIVDMTEIAEAIQSGEDVENDIGTVSDGFFWFPEEIQWAAQWQKDKEQDTPYGYFAMLLDPDIFVDEDDEDEIMAGIEYWWHRSQIYSAAYLINNRPLVANRYSEDVANESLRELLRMQEEVKISFAKQGVTIDNNAKPKDIWMIIRTTAQNIHNNVRGMH